VLLMVLGGALLIAAAASRSANGGHIPQAVIGLPVKAGSRVAVMGDSLAVGLGPALQAVALAAGVVYEFEGEGGTTPKQWALHDPKCGKCGDWLTSFQPTHVIVVLGTNDMGLPAPASQLQYYKQIIDGIQSLGAHPVWLQPPKMGKAAINAVRPVIDSLGVDVFHSQNYPIAISPDRVHPTGAGYASWATALWGWLTGSTQISVREQAAAEIRATPPG